MKRREFLEKMEKGALAAGVVATGGLLSACTEDYGTAGKVKLEEQQPERPTERPTYQWRMATTWPKGFPGLGTGAENLARLIRQLTNGQVEVRVFGAGEIARPFEIFDAVSNGDAEMGHASAYYWQNRLPGASFFSAVPFGLNAQEMNAWLYYGGGMELWQELYAPFGLVPTAAGNTGVQLGGWFNKEIISVEDLKGLRMRIPGFGGEVLTRLGGTSVSLPGGEIFSALQSGRLDAAEWVGPYNDLSFGLFKAAKYAYYPAWQEPSTCIECFINAKALEALPETLKTAVLQACRLANYEMLAEFTAFNSHALQTLINQHGVELKPFPQDVLRALKTVSEEVAAEFGAVNGLTRRIHASYEAFRKDVSFWHSISEYPTYQGRRL